MWRWGQLAANTAFSLLGAKWERIAGGTGQRFEKEIEKSESRMSRLKTEPWRRWAEGFSCFFFVLVGAPLAIFSPYRRLLDDLRSVLPADLVVYYPLFIFGLDQSKAGTLPPYSVWLGNVVLMAIRDLFAAPCPKAVVGEPIKGCWRREQTFVRFV